MPRGSTIGVYRKGTPKPSTNPPLDGPVQETRTYYKTYKNLRMQSTTIKDSWVSIYPWHGHYDDRCLHIHDELPKLHREQLFAP